MYQCSAYDQFNSIAVLFYEVYMYYITTKALFSTILGLSWINGLFTFLSQQSSHSKKGFFDPEEKKYIRVVVSPEMLSKFKYVFMLNIPS